MASKSGGRGTAITSPPGAKGSPPWASRPAEQPGSVTGKINAVVANDRVASGLVALSAGVGAASGTQAIVDASNHFDSTLNEMRELVASISKEGERRKAAAQPERPPALDAEESSAALMAAQREARMKRMLQSAAAACAKGGDGGTKGVSASLAAKLAVLRNDPEERERLHQRAKDELQASRG